MLRMIGLNEAAKAATDTFAGLIIVSGPKRSGKTTTVNLLTDEYRSLGSEDSIFVVDLNLGAIHQGKNSRAIIPFEPLVETDSTTDEDRKKAWRHLRDWRQQFKLSLSNSVPWVVVIDDMPDWMTAVALDMALAGSVVIVSFEADSAKDAIEKMKHSLASDKTGEISKCSDIDSAVEASIWQEIRLSSDGSWHIHTDVFNSKEAFRAGGSVWH